MLCAPGPRVLVVDDDPTLSEVVGRYLTREGFRVEFAELPDASREKVARYVFQVQREELARRREAGH